MNRIGKLLVLLLLAPAAAWAQNRPSNTMHTRSAQLYLDRAERAQVTDERNKLFDQATAAALQGVQSDADNPRTWFVLGQIHARRGDAAAADSAFDKAEALWPEYKEETEQERFRAYATSFNAGIAAIQANNLAEAAAKLEAASVVYSGKPTALLNLGNVYSRTQQHEKAADAYRRALQILRSDARSQGTAAEQKEWKEWEEAATFNLAQILALTNKNEEAAKAYEEYLARDPNNIMAKSNLAVVYSRMGRTDEAARIYQELLGRDLSDEDYFSVGVGLFRGEQYEQAANAFRKSLAKNPALRDAYYNLAQTLYSQIGKIEDERAKAKVAEQKAFDARLKPLYEELVKVAEKAYELDPNNRNVLALQARAYRGLADLVDVKTSTELKNKTVKVLETHQNLPFEVSEVQLLAQPNEAKITGNVVNLKLPAGQPISLDFTLLGKDGSVLGVQRVTVTAPAAEEQVSFNASFKTTAPVGGWKYTVAS